MLKQINCFYKTRVTSQITFVNSQYKLRTQILEIRDKNLIAVKNAAIDRNKLEKSYKKLLVYPKEHAIPILEENYHNQSNEVVLARRINLIIYR